MAVATLNSLNPTTAEPGEILTLNGANFAAGAVVDYQAEGYAAQDAAPMVLSAIAMTSIVPDVLLGLGGQVQVSVKNPSEAASNSLVFQLTAVPDVEASAPLCAVGAVRRLLAIGANETVDNSRIQRLIETASAQIRRYCRVDFTQKARTNEKYDGDGTSMLELRGTPIAAVTALAIDGQAVDVAELKVYQDYIAFEDSGEYNSRLRALERVFPVGRQNITVTYSEGYAKIPRTIADACALQVVFLMNTAQKQGVASEGNQTQGLNSTYSEEELSPAVRRMCREFRKVKVLPV